jgi:hypothetical protein
MNEIDRKINPLNGLCMGKRGNAELRENISTFDLHIKVMKISTRWSIVLMMKKLQKLMRNRTD